MLLSSNDINLQITLLLACAAVTIQGGSLTAAVAPVAPLTAATYASYLAAPSAPLVARSLVASAPLLTSPHAHYYAASPYVAANTVIASPHAAYIAAQPAASSLVTAPVAKSVSAAYLTSAPVVKTLATPAAAVYANAPYVTAAAATLPVARAVAAPAPLIAPAAAATAAAAIVPAATPIVTKNAALTHFAVNRPVVAAKTAALVEPEFVDPHPQYKFAYNVQDTLTGDSKTQEEVRDGDVVRGSYSLIEPDGSRRIVNYYADSLNGFNAVVQKDVPVAAAVAPIVAAKTISAPLPIAAKTIAAPIIA